MKIIDIPQRTPDWHIWRNCGISASDAEIILNRSPYKTPFRLYAEKKGLILPDNLDCNPHVRRGVRLEPLAIKAFELRHDSFLLPLCGQSEMYPFIRASFDGVDDDGIPVEVKAPTEKFYRDAEVNGVNSEVYRRYYSQVQQQILVADTQEGWLSLYLNDKECLDFHILRDDLLIQEIISAGRLFVDGLISNRPPVKDLARDIFIPEESELIEWNHLAANYHANEEMIADLKSKIVPLDNQQDGMEKLFISMMGDYAHAESAGLRISRYIPQGTIDYKAALMALNPDVDPAFLETFRKESSERSRFTVKDESKASVPFSKVDIMAAAFDGDYWF
jgi:putative phage-type endonuclease